MGQLPAKNPVSTHPRANGPAGRKATVEHRPSVKSEETPAEGGDGKVAAQPAQEAAREAESASATKHEWTVRILINLFFSVVLSTLLIIVFFMFRGIPVIEGVFKSSSYPEMSIIFTGVLAANGILLLLSFGKELDISFGFVKLTFNPNIKSDNTPASPIVFGLLAAVSVIMLVIFSQSCDSLPLQFDIVTAEGSVTYPAGAEIELPVGSNFTITAKSPNALSLLCHWDGAGNNLSALSQPNSCKNTVMLNDEPGHAILTVQASAWLCKTKTLSMIVIDAH